MTATARCAGAKGGDGAGDWPRRTRRAPAFSRAGGADARAEQWWFTFWDVNTKVWFVTHGAGIPVAVVDTGVNL
ncbi:hypothetical protein [Nonomuraea sp. NPDC005501]|uniref:hypothetical protein n=1 Tax=Nonomuraea sp. NPDC005501 TaxID=3156884 RepID=UPI0033B2E3DE